MPRPLLLFTNGWTDRPFEQLAAQASQWGYAGFELACAPNWFEPRRAFDESGYLAERLQTLGLYDLTVPILSNHRIGQALCDRIDERHREFLPDSIWGDGQPDGVRRRATEEMVSTVKLAPRIGATVVGGFTGSPLSSYIGNYLTASDSTIQLGLREFAKNIAPVLEACRDAGVKFALEVHPGQIAFDLYSAGTVLDALHGAEEFGFTFDPAHLFWQGVDPVEFLREYPNRIYHVHARDAVLTLNGKTGILNGYLPGGDRRRGFQFRSPGHGTIDWEGIYRELDAINYAGAIAVDYHDRGLPRDAGAEDAAKFLKGFDILG